MDVFFPVKNEKRSITNGLDTIEVAAAMEMDGVATIHFVSTSIIRGFAKSIGLIDSIQSSSSIFRI